MFLRPPELMPAKGELSVVLEESVEVESVFSVVEPKVQSTKLRTSAPNWDPRPSSQRDDTLSLNQENLSTHASARALQRRIRHAHVRKCLRFFEATVGE